MLIFFSFQSLALSQKRGLGVMLGNPTGLNGKYWLKDNQAVDAGAGWSFGRHTNFSIHSDFLFHSKDALIFRDDYNLDLYYGLGGRMEFAGEIELGVRLPIGVVHELEGVESDVFMELAPVWDFVSHQGLEIHIVLGSRYYF